MSSEFFLNVENRVQGYKTRLEELHWSAPCLAIHRLIDDFQEEFAEFNDAMVEYIIPIHGFIFPSELKPILPDEKEFESLLESIRGLLISIKREASDSMMYSGLISLVDDFFLAINKHIYLCKLEKHEAVKK